jgi:hypothetical protein
MNDKYVITRVRPSQPRELLTGFGPSRETYSPYLRDALQIFPVLRALSLAQCAAENYRLKYGEDETEFDIMNIKDFIPTTGEPS